MSLSDDFENTFSKYVSSPAKQFNLGWIVTSMYFSLPVIIGVMLILYALLTILFNDSYLSGTKSKMWLIWIGWIGFAMIVVGLYLTVRNFSAVVKRINANIRVNKGDSLFQEDTAVTSFISQVNRGTNNIAIRDALENPIDFASNPNASLSHSPKVTRESLLRNEPTPFRSRPKNNAQLAARETSDEIKSSASNIERADKSTAETLNTMKAVVNTLPQTTPEERKAVEALQANIEKVQENTAQVQAEAAHIKQAAPVIEQAAAAASKGPSQQVIFNGPRPGQQQRPQQAPFFPLPTFVPQGATAPRAGPEQLTDAVDEFDFGGGFVFKY